jgi:hypothetical protein
MNKVEKPTISWCGGAWLPPVPPHQTLKGMAQNFSFQQFPIVSDISEYYNTPSRNTSSHSPHWKGCCFYERTVPKRNHRIIGTMQRFIPARSNPQLTFEEPKPFA